MPDSIPLFICFNSFTSYMRFYEFLDFYFVRYDGGSSSFKLIRSNLKLIKLGTVS